MLQIISIVFLFIATPAFGDDWVVLASDALNSTHLNTSSISRDAAGATRFRIRLVYHRKRDMMGLPYDIAAKDYVVACRSNLILSRQHFLLDGDEVVWTFPLSEEKVKADTELPAEVLQTVCR